MKIKHLFLVLLLFAARFSLAQEKFPFENEIKEFKKQDSVNAPAPGGILFIGSSSIRMWTDLQQRFPDKPIIRRGVGGSELQQWVKYYVPYLIYPYKPAKIFIYVGENDINDGHSAETVTDDYKHLYKMIREKLPHTKIYFMSIKPGPARFRFWPEMEKANDEIKAYVANKPRTYFIDVSTPIFKQNTNQPDSALFRPDYIHLNSEGYDRWQQVLTPYL